MICEPCTGGYVCLGTTITATPESPEDDGGYVCPAGHYCPEGSSAEIACAAGSHNPLTGSEQASACVFCAADLYQVNVVIVVIVDIVVPYSENVHVLCASWSYDDMEHQSNCYPFRSHSFPYS